MTPSKQAKAAGLKGLAEMSRICATSKETLTNWHRDQPRKFEVMLAGAVVVRDIDLNRSKTQKGE